MPYIIPSETTIDLTPTAHGTSEAIASPRLGKVSRTERTKLPPLKSALKMSRSTSNSPVTSPLPQYTSFSAAGRPIQRTKSAPAVGTYEPGPSSIPLPSPTAKSVRFPTDETTLERICTFRKHGKPIHVSTPVSGDETATETEGESSSASYFRYEGFVGLGLTLPQRERGLTTHRPKPPLSSLRALVTSLPIINPPLAPATKGETPFYEVDTAISSPIPSPAFDSTANVHLESLSCSSTDELQTSLSGDILVRNLSYSKNVTVRFTFDDWATISNVSAQYVESLPSFPTSFFQVQGRPVTTGDAAGFLSLVDQKEGGWDRFRFTIVFEHGAYSLSSRVLLMAARYAVDGKEWWDNNGGENYRIAFRLGGRTALTESPAAMTFAEAGHGSQGESPNSSKTDNPGRPPNTQSGSSTKGAGGRRQPPAPQMPHTSHAFGLYNPSQQRSFAYPQLTNLPKRSIQSRGERWTFGDMQFPAASLSIACRV